MSTQSERIRAVLAEQGSEPRRELAQLAFDAVVALPIGDLIDREALRESIRAGLTRDNADRIGARHVLPAIERVALALRGRPETVRDLLSEQGTRELRALVQAGKGPRYGFMRGAIDGDDLRRLIAPVVQQMLQQFTARLPIPGLAGAAGSSSGGGMGSFGGIVGRIGKQVQRSAGQLADVGRSMFGSVIREFSESATSDFRAALKERLKSTEGQRIIADMRERFVSHLLAVKADDVVQDLMHLPRTEIAALVSTVLDHQRELPLFQAIYTREFEAVLAEVAPRPARELLRELGAFEGTREQIVATVDRAIAATVESADFGPWLERLLARAEVP